MNQTILSAMLFLLLASPASAAQWTGGGADNNWSTGLNWDTTTPPGPTDTVLFDNTDAQSAALPANSIVDQNFSIANLQFRNGSSPAGNFQTVQINSGLTLTTAGFSAFTTTSLDKTNVFFVGDGGFVYNNTSGTMQVGTNNSAHFFTVDMSDLPQVDITANVVQIRAQGVYSLSPTVRSNATLRLGDNNTITANTLSFLGDSNADQHLQLGTMNLIKVNSIELGWGFNGIIPNIFFESGLTNPSAKFRDKLGTGAATLLMGKPSTGNGSNVQFNLTGGDVDAWFKDVIIGQSGSAGGARTGAGTFTFDKGSVLMNTAILGDGIGTGAATGVINVNGTGSMSVGVLTLGNEPNAGNSTGRVNINDSGEFRVTQVLTGSTAGAGIQTRELNLFGGTLGNIDGADLDINPLVSVILHSGSTKAIDVTANHVATYDGAISEADPAQGFSKTGAGTLLLGGASTFTGTLNVQAGTLGGNGSIAGHLLVDGGSLSPGESAGEFTIGSGEFTSNGIFDVEIGGLTQTTEYDHLLVTGDITVGGTLRVTLTDGFLPSYTDQFVVIDAANVFGQFDSVFITNAPGYFTALYLDDQVILTNYQLPEPATSMLLLVGLMGMVVRRKSKMNGQDC